MNKPLLTARLSRLILLGYAIDPGLLAPYVPPGTELDFHNHQTFVSLVGLVFGHPRVLGLPLPFFHDHAQVNLRFYVRRRIDGLNWRQGVAFIKQIVPRHLIAWAGRRLFNDNVVSLRMDRSHQSQAADTVLTEYGWRQGRERYSIRAVYPDRPVLPDPGSVQEFLLERYWGFGARRDGTCLQYQFKHPRWRICEAMDAAAALGDFYGRPFTGLFSRRPDLAFAADGSEVALHRGMAC